MHSFVALVSTVASVDRTPGRTVYNMFNFNDDEQSKPCGALPTVLKNGGTEKL